MRRSTRVMFPLMLGLLGCTGTPIPQENFGPPEGAESPRDAAAEDADGSAETPPSSDEAFELRLKAAYADCTSPTPGGTFSRRALRRAALSCTQYHLCGMQQASETLAESVQAHASETSDATRQQAQDAFATAFAIWSRIEVMQYGPLGEMATTASEDMYQGQNLREQLYSWPLVSSCRVDEQVIEQSYRDEGVEAQVVSAKGLDALEYLLFSNASGSACSATGETATAYAALSEDERESRKQAYAEALAGELSSLSDDLVALYANGSDFAQAFVDASGYPSQQEALNVLAWGLIYVEREVKDWKLGVPAGEILSAPISGIEAPYSGMSTRAMLENLRGFQAIFEGCGEEGDGIGFDDWLEQAGHGALSDDMKAAYAGAVEKIAALPASVDDATPSQLRSAFDALSELTTLMKGDFFGPGSPINLALPATIEGDTD